MVFGRRRRLDRSARERGVPPDLEVREHEHELTTGPYDLEDAPEDAVARVDLGALRVPAVKGADLRLDLNKAGTIVSATVRLAGSTMQIGAFAAPRQGGLWADVRAEILGTITTQGGTATEAEGPFGPELRARLARKAGPAPARFVGVDGPRWFLRALITGPAASDAAVAEPLEQALRQVIVVRGTEPMPVRELIPLRLPRDPNEAPAADTSDTGEE
ncbi:hypothetical protein BH20ACT5_BH20ACT5_20830 [soil metagenome]